MCEVCQYRKKKFTITHGPKQICVTNIKYHEAHHSSEKFKSLLCYYPQHDMQI